MPLTAPPFWNDPKKTPPIIYRVTAGLYGYARAVHVAITHPAPTKIPTICVGNITAGGAGKTPIVAALYDLFADQTPTILLRGYGGDVPGPHIVTVTDAPRTVGDEAMLHVRTGPTVIAKNRRDGIDFIAAQQPRPKLIIMDDGLQNRQIKPTVNIMVIDGAVGFGNAHLIPAGPLREPLPAALSRTHLVVIIGTDITGVRDTIARHARTLPITTARINPDITGINKTTPYMAVAGIGRPQKFFDTLNALDLTVVATKTFPDHFVYQKPDVNALFNAARMHHATIITTEKDAVKIRSLTDQEFAVLPIRAVFDDPTSVRETIITQLHQSS